MIFLFGCSAAGTSDLQLRMLRFLANLACFNFQFCVAKGLTQLLIFAGVEYGDAAAPNEGDTQGLLRAYYIEAATTIDEG